jgi:rubrerythrin
MRAVAILQPHRQEIGVSAVEEPGSRPADQLPPDDEGGDPACWLRRVCPECGRLADEDPPTRCPSCGTQLTPD